MENTGDQGPLRRALVSGLTSHKGKIKDVSPPKTRNENIVGTNANDCILLTAVFFCLRVSEVNIDSWSKVGCGRTVEEMCHVDSLWKKIELTVQGRRFKV